MDGDAVGWQGKTVILFMLAVFWAADAEEG